MAISVKYFASLRERLGRGEDRLDTHAATVAEIWARLNSGKALPDNVLIAVNMEYARVDQIVKDGDEVAFFPPVTGG
ncbi:MAG: molybdopterin converting factor subunit 1 [Gammaproteobacteria bacterium]